MLPQHQPGSILVGAHGGNGGAVGQALCRADGPSSGDCPRGGHYTAVGLSQTMYDALRIATWACVIVGVILLLVGLIAAWRAPRHIGA